MIQLQKNKKDFIECLTCIENLTDEVSIMFNSEKIFIRAVHPSNHCMLILNIKPTLFESYNVTKEIVYTLNISLLLKILKSSKNDMITLTPENDVLNFVTNKSQYTLNYYVGMKDDRPELNFEHKTKLKVDSNILFDTVSSCLDFDQIGAFELSPTQVWLQSKAHMIKSKLVLDVLSLKGIEDKVFFDFTYINIIKNIKNIFNNIELGLDNEFPLVIIGTNDNINFKFILANRVE